MKNTILKTAFIIAVATCMAATASARSTNNLNYNRLSNPQIGITAANRQAVGKSYTICNEKGKVIVKGIIRSADVFYISTQKLSNGTYVFKIEGEVVQEFVIR